MRIGITCNILGQLEPPPGAAPDWDEEFDKPETIETIASALRGLGHTVEVLGDGPPMLRRILDDPPDFVFNFAEGTGVSRSRESRVPGVLEMLGIPYSGSDPLTLAVTLDKECAKQLVRAAGLHTPRWITVRAQDPKLVSCHGAGRDGSANPPLLDAMRAEGLDFPVFIKPAYEGSSKGVGLESIVDSIDMLEDRLQTLRATYQQPILIEELITGDEVTVGVLGNDPPAVLGMMRVLPKRVEDQPPGRFVYSLEAKRQWRQLIQYETPARISAEWSRRLETAALAVYRALECRDMARIDFRMRGDEPYFLEVNPLPGLHPENSDLVMIARGAGLSHAQLVQGILRAACQRHHLAWDAQNCHAADFEKPCRA